MSGPERVRIHYRRPPDREQVFDQTVVLDRPDVIVTLAEEIDLPTPMRIDDRVALEPGSSAVWFTFPEAWHDIGRFYRADGTFTGIYANVLTPVKIEGRVWETTDLFLDVWIGPEGLARILDRDEFDEATEAGWIDPVTASRALEEADALARGAYVGSWPPAVVADWSLERARAAVRTGGGR